MYDLLQGLVKTTKSLHIFGSRIGFGLVWFGLSLGSLALRLCSSVTRDGFLAWLARLCFAWVIGLDSEKDNNMGGGQQQQNSKTGQMSNGVWQA